MIHDRPLPTALLLACFVPVAFALALVAAREVGGPDLVPEVRITLFLVVVCTLQAALIARALRGVAAQRAQTRSVADALAALERAERALAAQAHLTARAGPTGPEQVLPTRRGVSIAAWAIVALLATGGVVIATQVAPAPPDLVHFHPAIAVFANGQRVDLSDPAFDLSQRRFMGAHLHAPEGEILHVEGGEGVTLGEFFERTLGGVISADELRVGEFSFHANATHRVRLFVAASEAPFVERHDPARHAFGPEDRILVTLTDGATVAQEWASVAMPGPILL